MSAKIVSLPTRPRPKTFTTAEALIEEVRVQIFQDGHPYKQVALGTGVSQGTISRLANGHTKWPRPTTLFPLMNALGVELQIVKRKDR